jgi:hypothetical protein
LAACEVERISMTGKVVGSGSGCLIALRSGPYHVHAETSGRLVLARPCQLEQELFRVVPDFHQNPVHPQYSPNIRMFRRRLQLIDQTGNPASQKPQYDSRRLILLTTGNRISGWYRLRIDSPVGALRRVAIEAFESPSSLVYRFESQDTEHRFAGYLFISPKIPVIEFLLSLSRQQTEAVAVRLRPISALEYVWHSRRRGFLGRPKLFLQYYCRPVGTVLFRPDYPCPPATCDRKQSLVDRQRARHD